MTVATAPRVDYDLDLLRLQHDGAYVQDQFFCCTAPYVYFKAGRGAGKSTVLCFDAVSYAEECPGSTQLFTEPTYQMVERVALPVLSKLYGRLRGKQIDWNESPPIDIHLSNGSVIWMAAADSLDEDRLRGMNLARLLMDEATLGRQEGAFHIASASVRDLRFPLQRKLTGTPKGRNWTWRLFTGTPLSGSREFIAHSQDAEDCGFLPKDWVEERAQEMGGWNAPMARQELLAQELEMAGQVHPQFRRDVHVRSLDRRRAEAMAEGRGTHAIMGQEGAAHGISEDAGRGASQQTVFKATLGGIDFGGVSPTALVVGGLDGGGRAWAVAEFYRHQATLDEVAAAMADLEARHGRSVDPGGSGRLRWIADPSGKAEIAKLRNMGFEVSKARHGNSLELRVQLMGARLNLGPGKLPGIYFTPECPNLIAEVEGLMWRRTRLTGGGEEMLTDAFERGTPDHAWDAMVNILAEWDAVPEPWEPPAPMRVWGA